MQFSPEQVGRLEQYVSSATDNVFVVLLKKKIRGKVGAAFARYSRAAGGFRETFLKEFIDNPDQADKVIERILIKFGDDSVQEFESAFLSMEQISNVATKAIEDKRLAAYIEQSTRYVFYDEKNERGEYKYYRPRVLIGSGLDVDYIQTMDAAFDLYSRLIQPMKEYFQRRKPLEVASYKIREEEPDRELTLADCRDDVERKTLRMTYNQDIRTKTCDTLRLLLPMSTTTNLGVHANGRSLSGILTSLYSSDIGELNELAAKSHEHLNRIMPRYVQRAKRDEYLVQTRRAFGKLAHVLTDELLALDSMWPSEAVELGVCSYNRNTREQEMIATMALFEHCHLPISQLYECVHGSSRELVSDIVSRYVGERRTRRDRVGRAFETGYPWHFQFLADIGSFRNLHRHRMCTFQRQAFTTKHGFMDIPPEIIEAGFQDDVLQLVDQVNTLHTRLVSTVGEEEAQYAVLFGHKIRYAMGFNLREAQHLLELRTGKQGHRDYRRLCQQMYHIMIDKAPWVAKVLEFVDLNEYDWPRADALAGIARKESKLDTQ